MQRSWRNSSCLLNCKVFRVRKLSHTSCVFVFQQTINTATYRARGSCVIWRLVSPVSCVISQDAEPNARIFLFTSDLLVPGWGMRDVRFVACDLLVSVRGMTRCTICCLWFAGICARHDKMHVLLSVIFYSLCEAWHDTRFVVCDLLAGQGNCPTHSACSIPKPYTLNPKS